jgi:hypothetical protein
MFAAIRRARLSSIFAVATAALLVWWCARLIALR